MDSLTKSERILHGSLYCLTFVTGLVDAGSYVAMGHAFTANMTGNIVYLAGCQAYPSDDLLLRLASPLQADCLPGSSTLCSGNDGAIYGLRLPLGSRHCFYWVQ